MNTPNWKHTHGKWMVKLGQIVTEDSGEMRIATLTDGRYKAGNGMIICRAVNNHATLVSVLAKIQRRMDRWRSNGIEPGPRGRDADWAALVTDVNNALAQDGAGKEVDQMQTS